MFIKKLFINSMGLERHSNEALGHVLISSLLQSVSTCIKKKHIFRIPIIIIIYFEW
jgi:hypothetical protein